MPTAARHPCTYPRCSATTEDGGRCPLHQRPSAAQRYPQGWAAYSRAWLHRFPWCGMRQDGQLHAVHSQCVRLGLRTPARCTDHIVSQKDGGEPMDEANSQSLCIACNNRKNIEFEGGFGR